MKYTSQKKIFRLSTKSTELPTPDSSITMRRKKDYSLHLWNCHFLKINGKKINKQNLILMGRQKR